MNIHKHPRAARYLTKLITDLQSLGRAKVWRQRYVKLKNVEKDLRSALEGDDPNALDDAIERYESLQMNLNPNLLQQAISKRNLLVKKRTAARALKAANKSTDVEVLKVTPLTSSFSSLIRTWHTGEQNSSGSRP